MMQSEKPMTVRRQLWAFRVIEGYFIQDYLIEIT